MRWADIGRTHLFRPALVALQFKPCGKTTAMPIDLTKKRPITLAHWMVLSGSSLLIVFDYGNASWRQLFEAANQENRDFNVVLGQAVADKVHVARRPKHLLGIAPDLG